MNYLDPREGKEITGSTGEIRVRLVGGSFHESAFATVKEGDEVTLQKEPKNKYDRYAIVVLSENNRVLGYIANRVETIGRNKATNSAADVYRHINDRTSAIIIDKSPSSAVLLINASNEVFLNRLKEEKFDD
jgi:hypothetical protein